MTVASVTATSAASYVINQSPLTAAIRRIQVALIHEIEILPGSVLAYGRPHEHARNRYLPRWSRTGFRIPGVNRVRPDCPRPIRGRCECAPDGSWRPVGGAMRADATAINAAIARGPGNEDRLWVDIVYVEGPDGLWRCIRPTRRALERLRGESMRRFLVLNRLLDGDEISEAWYGLGQAEDPVSSALGIIEQVERWSDEEASAEYEHRPRRWRCLPWTELSESQQSAVMATEVVA